MEGWQEQLRIIAEVACAMLLGGAIGYERECAKKPAGFRTHMLVAGSAALLVGLGDSLLQRFRNPYLTEAPRRRGLLGPETALRLELRIRDERDASS